MNGFHKLATGGFTLIETMVAISILTFAMAGPLFTASRAIVAAQTARDQLTATYLAQEAIEQVRFMRDTNVLLGDDWMAQGLGNCDDNEVVAGCYIDVWQDADLTVCPEEGCPILKYNSTSRRYQYSNGEDTSFRRTINIEDTPNTFEKVITVRVEWRSGVQAHSVVITDRIFDWASGLI